MIVIVMGVAGSGKTTVGALLATALRCPFLDADSLHPISNLEKMRRGEPLTDFDRAPWLDAVHGKIAASFRGDEDLVVACSALRRGYRKTLARGVPAVWVYLRGSEELIRSRLASRKGHFLPVELLRSQMETLEEPTDAIVEDASASPVEIVERILKAIGDNGHRRAAGVRRGHEHGEEV